MEKDPDQYKCNLVVLRGSHQNTLSNEPPHPLFLTAADNFTLVTTLNEKIRMGVFDVLKYCWSLVASLGAVYLVGLGLGQKCAGSPNMGDNCYVLPTEHVGTYFILIFVLTVLFYLEGMMICIVATQYWDKEQFKDAFPRAYRLHTIMNKPDNMKRFIIGRQFCTVLTGS